MFHFPAYPPRHKARYPPMTAGGFPHSETPGSKPGWRLPGAYRCLQRPSSVPCAKASTMSPYRHGHPATTTGTQPGSREDPQRGPTKMPDDNHHTDDHKRSTPAHQSAGNQEKSQRDTHAAGTTPAPRDARSRPLSSSQTTGPRPRRNQQKPETTRTGQATKVAAREPKSTSHATPATHDTQQENKPPHSAASTAPRPRHNGKSHDRRHKRKLHRKEVIQPHLPVRLPCYDLVPITSLTLDGSPHKGRATGFGCCRLS